MPGTAADHVNDHRYRAEVVFSPYCIDREPPARTGIQGRQADGTARGLERRALTPMRNPPRSSRFPRRTSDIKPYKMIMYRNNLNFLDGWGK